MLRDEREQELRREREERRGEENVESVAWRDGPAEEGVDRTGLQTSISVGHLLFPKSLLYRGHRGGR